MKINMHSIDRTIRLLIAVTLFIMYFTGVISGTFGIALLIVAIIFTFTTIVGFCPIYRVFGISTCKIK